MRFYILFILFLLSIPIYYSSAQQIASNNSTKDANLENICPENFINLNGKHFRYCYRKIMTPYLKELMKNAEQSRKKVIDKLYLDSMPQITVWLLAGPQELKKVAPSNLPSWAAAVTYPEKRLILLPVLGSSSRIPLDAVFSHELTHMALHDITKGRFVPRWFNEGLAINVSGELFIERIKILVQSVAFGNIRPIKSIDRFMPAHEYQATLSYAESGDFVMFLYKKGGKGRIRGLLYQIRDGNDFYQSLTIIWGKTWRELEGEWRENLLYRFGFFPIISAGSTIWILIVVLLLWAFIKRRREQKLKIEAMIDEDEIDEDGIDENEIDENEFKQ